MEEINIDVIKDLRLQRKNDEADEKLREFRKNNVIRTKIPKPRKVSITITLPIQDVIFLDENKLKASIVLQDAIKRLRNE